MKIQLSNLIGCSLYAKDRRLGSVTDVLIDPVDWAIRYVVVDIDAEDKSAVVSPSSIETYASGRLDIEFSVPRIRGDHIIKHASIDFENRPMLSRDDELEIVNRFLWPVYWLGRDDCIADPSSMRASGVISLCDIPSLQLLIDGEKNCVVDFLIDTESWLVRSAIIDRPSNATCVERLYCKTVTQLNN